MNREYYISRSHSLALAVIATAVGAYYIIQERGSVHSIQPVTPSAGALIPGPDQETVVPLLFPTEKPTTTPATATATVTAVKEPVSPLPKGARVVTWKGLEDATIKIWTGKEWENRPISQFKGPVKGLKGKEGAGSDLIGFEDQEDNYYVIIAADGKNFRAALPKDLQTLDNITAPTKTPVPAKPTFPAARPSPAATTEAQPTVPTQPTVEKQPTVAAPPPTATTAPTEKPTPPAPIEKELKNLNIPGLRVINHGRQYGISITEPNRDKLAKLFADNANGRELEIRFYDNVDNNPLNSQSRIGNFYTYLAQGDAKAMRAWIAVSPRANAADLSDPGSLLTGQILFVVDKVVTENFLANNETNILAAKPNVDSKFELWAPSIWNIVPVSKITFMTQNEFGVIGGIRDKEGNRFVVIKPQPVEDDQAA